MDKRVCFNRRNNVLTAAEIDQIADKVVEKIILQQRKIRLVETPASRKADIDKIVDGFNQRKYKLKNKGL